MIITIVALLITLVSTHYSHSRWVIVANTSLSRAITHMQLTQEPYNTLVQTSSLSLSLTFPTEFNLADVDCACIRTHNQLHFNKNTSNGNEFSWVVRNPSLEGVYRVLIRIMGNKQEEYISEQSLMVSISPRFRIGQSYVGGSVSGMSIVTSNSVVGALSNYTITLALNQSVSGSNIFYLAFPDWILGLIPEIASSQFSCGGEQPSTVQNCSWTNQSPIMYLKVNLMVVSAASNLVVYLYNMHNPSSTESYVITGYVYYGNVPIPNVTVSTTISMITPATATVLIPGYNLTLGTSSNSNIQFRGSLYFPVNGGVDVSYQNLNLTLNGNPGASNLITFYSVNDIQNSTLITLAGFSFSNPSFECNVSITVSTFYLGKSNQKCYIQTGVFTGLIIPGSITITHSGIVLLTSQIVQFVFTIPFTFNKSSTLEISLSQNASLYNYTTPTNANQTLTGLSLTVPAGQSTVKVSIGFQFGYFITSPLSVSLYLDNNITAQNSISLSNSCGQICKTCNNNDSSICLECFPSTVTSYIYLYNSRCIQTCPNGTYPDSLSCKVCPVECSTCVNLNTCTSCLTGFALNASTKQCDSNCGLGSYPKGGECLDCPNYCLKCVNESYCVSCQLPTVLVLNQCVQPDCKGDCQTCDQTGVICYSCKSGLLYQQQCYSECPVGTVQLGRKCLSASSVATFPFLILTVIFCIGFGCSKLVFKNTDIYGIFMAVCGLFEVGVSLATALVLQLNQYSMVKQSLLIGIGLACYLVTNIGFLVFYIVKLRKDQTFVQWKSKTKNTVVLYLTLVLSTVWSFKIFKGLYSRFLAMSIFSAKFTNSKGLLLAMNCISGVNFLTSSVLAVAGAAMALVNSPSSFKGTQGFYFCIQLIVIQVISFVFIILDLRKPESYFAIETVKIENLDQNAFRTELDGTLGNIVQDSVDQNPKSPLRLKGVAEKKNSSQYKNPYVSPILNRGFPTNSPDLVRPNANTNSTAKNRYQSVSPNSRITKPVTGNTSNQKKPVVSPVSKRANLPTVPTLNRGSLAIPGMSAPVGFRDTSETVFNPKRNSNQKHRPPNSSEEPDNKQEHSGNPYQSRKGNRYIKNRARHNEAVSNQQFDIYLDFDHQLKDPKAKEDSRPSRVIKGSKSTELKGTRKQKQVPINDIYVGFLNTEDDKALTHETVQVQKSNLVEEIVLADTKANRVGEDVSSLASFTDPSNIRLPLPPTRPVQGYTNQEHRPIDPNPLVLDSEDPKLPNPTSMPQLEPQGGSHSEGHNKDLDVEQLQ